jgi:hypothetical protein
MEKRSTLKAVSEQSLFAPPPVIEEEDAAAYDEFYGRVCAAIKPADVIDEMLIVDIVVLELDILRLRRWKSNRTQERGLEALEHFLRKELDYKHYRERFADDLTEILRGNLPDDQAQTLARACAWNESDAVDKVIEVLDGIGWSRNYILKRAQAHEAQALTHKYRRREPATVKFIDKLLAAAGRSIGSLTVESLPKELEYIERIDRLTTIAESRRNTMLREIDRRRVVLGQTLRRQVQEVEGEFEVVEKTPPAAKSSA